MCTILNYEFNNIVRNSIAVEHLDIHKVVVRFTFFDEIVQMYCSSAYFSRLPVLAYLLTYQYPFSPTYSHLRFP